mmetsp:Transcript_1473/g.3152  ORF Transcript_1473/g.3152 Transcript_1473/m.3152 type:complete len:148 (-) Transcript_1473:228-671(-)
MRVGLLLLLPLASSLRLEPLRTVTHVRRAASPAPTTPRHPSPLMGEGNALLDALYALGCIGALSFAFRNVFDSIFFENEGFRPPMPVLKNPLSPAVDPVEEAEALRAKMQAAIDAQDMEAAYRTEKELKQLMMEYGIRFEAEGREDS